jgi:hypothetical protein
MAALRRANGSRSGMAFRSTNDPQEVVLLLDWENSELGRRFAQSAEVQGKLQEGGVSYFEVYADPDHIEA